jgi:hypothetical protein
MTFNNYFTNKFYEVHMSDDNRELLSNDDLIIEHRKVLDSIRNLGCKLISRLDGAVDNTSDEELQGGKIEKLVSILAKISTILIRTMAMEQKLKDILVYGDNEIDVEADKKIMAVHDARIEARVREQIRLEQLKLQEGEGVITHSVIPEVRVP